MQPESLREVKQCPYCGEIIYKEAIVCRYSKNGLIDENTKQEVTTEKIRNLTDRQTTLKDAVNKYLAVGWVSTGITSDYV